MKLKLNEIDIPAEKPFDNDVLNREQHAESLTELVSKINMPFVIGIDSEWGTGKTTFLKMWRQLLINNEFPTIYYNSWENDFSDSALVSILGKLKMESES